MIVLLVSVVSFLAKNLTKYFIVESWIEGYALIALTEAIVIMSPFDSSYSSPYFRLDAWTMETCE